MKTNELYRIARGDEQHYFTSLYRISKFLNKQRTQVEYTLLRGKDVNGWTVDIVDGTDVCWKEIDLESK